MLRITLRRMAITPDMSPRAIRDGQAERLTRLRIVLELGLAEAAEMAGLTRHKYSRMERGLHNIDTVALGLLTAKLGIPAEYVVSGGLVGLSDHLIRNLTEREVRDREVAAGRMVAVPELPRRGRPRRKGKAHSAPEGSTVVAAPALAGALGAGQPGARLRKVT